MDIEKKLVALMSVALNQNKAIEDLLKMIESLDDRLEKLEK
jgi:hypothetical protein